VSTTLAEINVIPLVDVMLVLLIIFMVAAPMLQRGVEVSLPQATRRPRVASERLFVDVPFSYRRTGASSWLQGADPRGVLGERMRQRLVNRSDKQVFVRSDKRLQVQALIDVLDALKAGGVRERRHRHGVSRGAMNEPASDVIAARAARRHADADARVERRGARGDRRGHLAGAGAPPTTRRAGDDDQPRAAPGPRTGG
jgi:biopolymer transport protein ExbD